MSLLLEIISKQIHSSYLENNFMKKKMIVAFGKSSNVVPQASCWHTGKSLLDKILSAMACVYWVTGPFLFRISMAYITLFCN